MQYRRPDPSNNGGYWARSVWYVAVGIEPSFFQWGSLQGCDCHESRYRILSGFVMSRAVTNRLYFSRSSYIPVIFVVLLSFVWMFPSYAFRMSLILPRISGSLVFSFHTFFNYISDPEASRCPKTSKESWSTVIHLLWILFAKYDFAFRLSPVGFIFIDAHFHKTHVLTFGKSYHNVFLQGSFEVGYWLYNWTFERACWKILSVSIDHTGPEKGSEMYFGSLKYISKQLKNGTEEKQIANIS